MTYQGSAIYSLDCEADTHKYCKGCGCDCHEEEQ